MTKRVSKIIKYIYSGLLLKKSAERGSYIKAINKQDFVIALIKQYIVYCMSFLCLINRKLPNNLVISIITP